MRKRPIAIEFNAGVEAPATGSSAPPPPPGVIALADEAAALDGQAASPELSIAAPDAAPPVPTDRLLCPLIVFLFSTAAPNWKVSDTECAQLAKAYAAVLDKYFPDGVLSQWGVELNALLLTVAIVGPRVNIPTTAAPKKSEAPATPEKLPEGVDAPLVMQ